MPFVLLALLMMVAALVMLALPLPTMSLALAFYPSSALAASAADGLVELFAVVTDGTEKHPSF